MNRENEYISFSQVLKHSLSVEKTTPAFCEICKKFTPTNQYARVCLPLIYDHNLYLHVRYLNNVGEPLLGNRITTNPFYQLWFDK